MSYSIHRVRHFPLAITSEVLAHILLYSLILLPAIGRPWKLLNMLALGFFVLIELWAARGKVRVHPLVLSGIFATLLLGLLWSWLGQWRGGPGVAESLEIFVVAPIAYLPMIVVMSRPGALRRISFTLLVSTVLASAISVLQLFSVFGSTPSVLNSIIDLYPENGFTAAATYEPRVLSSIVFLLPFAGLWLLYQSSDRRDSTLLPSILGTALGIGASLLGARNAFLLILLVVPLIAVSASTLLPSDLRGTALRRLVVVLVVFSVSGGGLLWWQADDLNWTLTEDVLSLLDEFSPQNSSGAQIRFDQADKLLSAVSDTPVVGRGLGTAVPGFVRDTSQPWRYELRYLALWFQMGTFGLLIVGTLVLGALLLMAHTVWRDPYSKTYLIPYGGALLCSLLAEATNPYLTSIGFLWVIFLPIGALNSALISTGSEYEG